MSRLRIIWLCSWYPNRLDPYDGDFIQRHARAASLYNDIHVIHIVPDSSGTTREPETVLNSGNGLTEQVIYFRKQDSLWGRLQARFNYFFLFRKALRNYVVKYGRPDAVHVQVPVKAGIPALWFRKRYKIPYLVTEHWGIYNSIAEDHYGSRSRLFRHYTRKIFTNTSGFISVSRYLAEGVNRMVCPVEFNVIPNVVDTNLFHPSASRGGRFRFIHVSNMAALKNAGGIIRAFSSVCRANNSIELVMVGDRDPSIRELASSQGLPENTIRFTGEISYADVAREMQDSHCLVLFSDIENSPCVIGEALCCGLPVIATRVGGIPELLDTSCSILTEPGDEKGLEKAMVEMIGRYKEFNSSVISETASIKFGYEGAGLEMDRLYRRVAAGKTP